MFTGDEYGIRARTSAARAWWQAQPLGKRFWLAWGAIFLLGVVFNFRAL